MPRSNKFIKFDDIPLAQLFLGKSNVRTENIEEGLDDLAEHIYANGLLETIVVFDIEIAQIRKNSIATWKASNLE